MLFMVTSTHDYQTCGAHIPEVSGLLKTLTKKALPQIKWVNLI